MRNYHSLQVCEKAVSLRREGKTIEEVASIMRVSKYAVKQMIEKYGRHYQRNSPANYYITENDILPDGTLNDEPYLGIE